MAIGDQSVSNKGDPRTPAVDPVRCGGKTLFLSAGPPLRPINTLVAEDENDDSTDVAADCGCDIRVLYNKVKVLPLIGVDLSDDESGTDDCFFRVVHRAFHILPCTVTTVTESTGRLEGPSKSTFVVVDSNSDGGSPDVPYNVGDDNVDGSIVEDLE